MSILRKNVIANFIGQVWSSLLGIIFVPVYLYYLGVEAYGLVGFFLSLRAIFELLDFGLSTTTNREIARRKKNPHLIGESRNILRTLEIVYLVIGVAIVAFLFLSSGWIANKWLNLKELSPQTVKLAIMIFAISVAVGFQIRLYSGVLRGLERQVLLNGLNIAVATLSYIGSVVVIIFISRTITAFLIWQLFSSIVEMCINASVSWVLLRSSGPKSGFFSFSVLRSIWKFSIGVAGISMFAAVLKQMDKVIMSKFASLEGVGYYSTAGIANSAISLLVGPFSKAIFPRFSSLISENNTAALAKTYHNTTQLLLFLVSPLGGIFIFFAYDLLLLWTRSQTVALNSWLTLSILAYATMVNSTVHIIYPLQLAAGLTWIPLWSNGLSVLILGPLMFYLILHYGIIGGAVSWAIYNTLYYLIPSQITHLYVLKGHFKSWVFKDTLPFMLLSSLIFGMISIIKIRISANIITTLAMILLGGIVYLVVSLAFYPYIRNYLKNYLTQFDLN